MSGRRRQTSGHAGVDDVPETISRVPCTDENETKAVQPSENGARPTGQKVQEVACSGARPKTTNHQGSRPASRKTQVALNTDVPSSAQQLDENKRLEIRRRERSSEQETNWRQPTKTGPITVQKMEQMLQSPVSPNDVISSILSPRCRFLEQMQNSDLEKSFLEPMLGVIAKAVFAEHERKNTLVLMKVFIDSTLARNVLPTYLLEQSILSGSVPEKEPFMNLARILQKLLWCRPSSSLVVVDMLTALLKRVVQSFPGSFCKLATELEEIQTICEGITRQIQGGELVRDQEKDVKWQQPPNDYRTLPVIPTAKDISAHGTPFLRKNIVFGAYRDLDHYLDVQFRLFREDFVGPLREGINELIQAGGRRRGHFNQDIQLYSGVKILALKCSPVGIAHVVEFSKKHVEKVRKKKSKSLNSRFLVCLTDDLFKTVLFGTVAEKEAHYLKQNQILVAFDEQNPLPENHLHRTYEMVESPSFFEAYRYNLEGMKTMNRDNMPFQQYLLNTAKNAHVRPPRYLQVGDQKVYDFSSLLNQSKWGLLSRKSRQVPVLDLKSWPTAEELRLNPSQYTALQNALTREVALVQGPPGTGKTFIGLKIAEILLSNESVWNNTGAGQENHPILVVCYTNHALDQFLEGILPMVQRNARVGGQLIRIGGGGSSEKLLGCKLHAVRRQRRRYIPFPGEMEMEALSKRIENFSRNIHSLRDGIIHEKHLANQMTTDHISSLKSRSPSQTGTNSCMIAWLLGEAMLQHVVEHTTHSTGGTAPEETGSGRDDDVDGEDSLLQGKTSAPEVVLSRFAPPKETHRSQNQWKSVCIKKNVLASLVHGLDTVKSMSRQDAQRVRDVWGLPVSERWRLYHFWAECYIADQYQELQRLFREYNNMAAEAHAHKEEEDSKIVQQAKVVGMTTTGAAKHRRILQQVQPKIVIVEEAAEVFEAHIVTSLSSECEHLILIGDHQQLRPNPAVYELARDYHLDISLFERLVNSEMPCDRLMIQHRMRPEIAKLITPHIYKDLQNHESVLHYGHVAGVKKDVFFIDHREKEAAEKDTKSHLNKHEADYLVALCRYFLQQEYSPGQITVLTTYKGQMFAIQQAMRMKGIEDVRVTPVDDYQGEENDIILLSLVRSNEEGRIGFLKVGNRVCVALSRAKKGFFAIGNMKILSEGSLLWERIVRNFREDGNVGKALPLACQNHPDKETHVKCATDFARVPEGGCNRPCGARLKCGHACPKKCHPRDRDHKKHTCRKPCPKFLCEFEHRCPKKCYEKCEPCQVLVDKEMPDCRHWIKVPCYKEVTDVKCTFVIKDRPWPCGHLLSVECHYSPDNYKCRNPCIRILCDLEHRCPKKCDEECEPCQVLVDKEMPECHHSIKVPCYKEVADVKCTFVVKDRPWPCGHLLSVECHYSPDNYKCRNPCIRTLCDLEHRCPKKCDEECEPCQVLVDKEMPECHHSIKVPCYKEVADVKCTFVVKDRPWPCGHLLSVECYNSPDNFICQKEELKQLPCGHYTMLPCCVKPEDLGQSKSNCTETISVVCKRNEKHKYQVACRDADGSECALPCEQLLACGHVCTGTCHKCRRSGRHSTCQANCTRLLPCKHRCQGRCSQTCRPCTKTCNFLCGHKTYRAKCGSACDRCDENCMWQCEHLKCNKKCYERCDRGPCDAPCPLKLMCGHWCVGLCGEPCPPQCRQCHSTFFKNIERKWESALKKKPRFVLLQPCWHVVSVDYMDNIMNDPKLRQFPRPVHVYECPVCHRVLTYCPRYGNKLRKSRKELQAISLQATTRLSPASVVAQGFTWMVCKRGHVYQMEAPSTVKKERGEENLERREDSVRSGRAFLLAKFLDNCEEQHQAGKTDQGRDHENKGTSEKNSSIDGSPGQVGLPDEVDNEKGPAHRMGAESASLVCPRCQKGERGEETDSEDETEERQDDRGCFGSKRRAPSFAAFLDNRRDSPGARYGAAPTPEHPRALWGSRKQRIREQFNSLIDGSPDRHISNAGARSDESLRHSNGPVMQNRKGQGRPSADLSNERLNNDGLPSTSVRQRKNIQKQKSVAARLSAAESNKHSNNPQSERRAPNPTPDETLNHDQSTMNQRLMAHKKGETQRTGTASTVPPDFHARHDEEPTIPNKEKVPMGKGKASPATRDRALSFERSKPHYAKMGSGASAVTSGGQRPVTPYRGKPSAAKCRPKASAGTCDRTLNSDVRPKLQNGEKESDGPMNVNGRPMTPKKGKASGTKCTSSVSKAICSKRLDQDWRQIAHNKESYRGLSAAKSDGRLNWDERPVTRGKGETPNEKRRDSSSTSDRQKCYGDRRRMRQHMHNRENQPEGGGMAPAIARDSKSRDRARSGGKSQDREEGVVVEKDK